VCRWLTSSLDLQKEVKAEKKMLGSKAPGAIKRQERMGLA